MRLKSYLLVTGITAVALFGATPAFAADEASPEPGNGNGAPSESASPAEEAPGQPSAEPTAPGVLNPDPMSPEEEECWALIEESEESGVWDEDLELSELCQDIVEEWEAEEAEAAEPERGGSPLNPAAPAEPQSVAPTYTG